MAPNDRNDSANEDKIDRQKINVICFFLFYLNKKLRALNFTKRFFLI